MISTTVSQADPVGLPKRALNQEGAALLAQYEDLLTGKEVGASAYLTKPFYAKDVLAAARSGHEQPTNDDANYAIVTAHLKQAISDMIEEMRTA